MVLTVFVLRNDGEDDPDTDRPGNSSILLECTEGAGLASTLDSRDDGMHSRLCRLLKRAFRRIRSSAFAMSRAYDDAVGAYNDDDFRGDSGVEGPGGSSLAMRGGPPRRLKPWSGSKDARRMCVGGARNSIGGDGFSSTSALRADLEAAADAMARAARGEVEVCTAIDGDFKAWKPTVSKPPGV